MNRIQAVISLPDIKVMRCRHDAQIGCNEECCSSCPVRARQAEQALERQEAAYREMNSNNYYDWKGED